MSRFPTEEKWLTTLNVLNLVGRGLAKLEVWDNVSFKCGSSEHDLVRFAQRHLVNAMETLHGSALQISTLLRMSIHDYSLVAQ